ncbi:MAG: hypothetical protein AB2541_03980 [Candidatus Thiodiazotropha sp.]
MALLIDHQIDLVDQFTDLLQAVFQDHGQSPFMGGIAQDYRSVT